MLLVVTFCRLNVLFIVHGPPRMIHFRLLAIDVVGLFSTPSSSTPTMLLLNVIMKSPESQKFN